VGLPKPERRFMRSADVSQRKRAHRRRSIDCESHGQIDPKAVVMAYRGTRLFNWAREVTASTRALTQNASPTVAQHGRDVRATYALAPEWY
jgi:hypothetical protein